VQLEKNVIRITADSLATLMDQGPKYSIKKGTEHCFFSGRKNADTVDVGKRCLMQCTHKENTFSS
jgi:hypothetical protein